MQPILESKKDDLARLCRLLRVKRLYAFGSAVAGPFTDESDIDILFSFMDGLSVEEYTDNYFMLYQNLSEIFGRKVDLVTERTLSNPFFIKGVNDTKHLLYEAWA